jgi:hypothetical protein
LTTAPKGPGDVYASTQREKLKKSTGQRAEAKKGCIKKLTPNPGKKGRFFNFFVQKISCVPVQVF